VSENKGKKTSPGLIQFMTRKGLTSCGEASQDIKTCHDAGYFRRKKALSK
jgi:hypothetical protein